MTGDRQHPWTLRPAQEQDIEGICDVIDAHSQAILGVGNRPEKQVKLTWTQPGFDVTTDTRVVALASGEIVGYGEVEAVESPYVEIGLWVRVHPKAKGQGIEEALLEWTDARARQILPKAPPHARVVMNQGVASADKELCALFRRKGFELIRHFWRMGIEFEREIPVPAWPGGVAVRPFIWEDDLVPTVHAFRDAFQDHWGHVENTFEEELAKWDHWIRNDEDFDPDLTFLAVADDEIVGLVSCDLKHPEDPKMGYVAVLGVCRQWRRKGIALALLHHAFRALKERGQERACLGVDATSLTGANRVYRAAGMSVARQIDVFEKELRAGEDLRLQTLDTEGDSNEAAA